MVQIGLNEYFPRLKIRFFFVLELKKRFFLEKFYVKIPNKMNIFLV